MKLVRSLLDLKKSISKWVRELDQVIIICSHNYPSDLWVGLFDLQGVVIPHKFDQEQHRNVLC